jgi:hypothetical protein
MMPPTSIMDERYPAWKRNQEDAEKLMLATDLIGSAIPLAGPAAKGMVRLAQYAKPQVGQALENYAFQTGMALPMDVWHGSPHRFAATAKNPLGEFDPTKIGTGEGAQAYGHGLYFAENEGVAKGYRDNLTVDPRDQEGRLDDGLAQLVPPELQVVRCRALSPSRTRSGRRSCARPGCRCRRWGGRRPTARRGPGRRPAVASRASRAAPARPAPSRPRRA